MQLEGMENAVTSSSGFWGGAPAEIEFGALSLRFGGNTFNYSPHNELTKFANVLQLKRRLCFLFCLGGLRGLGPLATSLP